MLAGKGLEAESGQAVLESCRHSAQLRKQALADIAIQQIDRFVRGCGFGWLTVPYLGYDTTFGGLRNPPLFLLEGPDGSRIRVWLDRWASSRANYTQGARILKEPDSVTRAWIPHYATLGSAYPLQAILASGICSVLMHFLKSGYVALTYVSRVSNSNSMPSPTRISAARAVNSVLSIFSM